MPSKFHNRKAKIQKQQKLENNQQLKVDTVIIFKTISTEHYADSYQQHAYCLWQHRPAKYQTA